MCLQGCQVLVRDVINLFTSAHDEHVFASSFGASQRAVSVGHFAATVSGNHLCVAPTAHTVANLAGPCHLSGWSERGKTQQQADTAHNSQNNLHDLALLSPGFAFWSSISKR